MRAAWGSAMAVLAGCGGAQVEECLAEETRLVTAEEATVVGSIDDAIETLEGLEWEDVTLDGQATTLALEIEPMGAATLVTRPRSDGSDEGFPSIPSVVVERTCSGRLEGPVGLLVRAGDQGFPHDEATLEIASDPMKTITVRTPDLVIRHTDGRGGPEWSIEGNLDPDAAL